MRTRLPKVPDACSWLVDAARLRSVLVVDGQPAGDDVVEQVGVEGSGLVDEEAFVARQGLERARRDAAGQAPRVALGRPARRPGRRASTGSWVRRVASRTLDPATRRATPVWWASHDRALTAPSLR